MNEILLERIKELCKERGISQRQLQVALDLSSGSISKWRNSNPSHNTLDRTAKYFGVSTAYLIGDTNFRTQEEMLQHFNDTFLPIVDVPIDTSEGVPAHIPNRVREIAEVIDSKPYLYDFFVLANDLDVDDVLAVQAVLARFKVKN